MSSAEITAQTWHELEKLARAALTRAYAPYSKYPVGAAALTSDGRYLSGANIENASYGLGLCAECALISDLHRTGGGKLIAFACVDGKGAPLVPCGRCRQLLHEHGGPELRLKIGSGIVLLRELLPHAFGPEYLSEASETHKIFER